mgnify:CR=1 FL=1
MQTTQSKSEPTKSIGSEVNLPKCFYELFEDYRYKIYWGGRGSGKSWAFATALLMLGAREIQRSIRDSVHNLLADRIKALGFENFYTVQQNQITGVNGTQFLFAGLYANPESLKSMESLDIVWIEEANTVSDNSWRLLIPTVRKEGSQIWASFNPALKSDPVYQRFVLNKPDNAIVKKVSHRDNPWLTKPLKDEMQRLKEYDHEEYLHVYEGELKQFADGSIYAKQLKTARDDKRICWLPVESVPVATFWDLGRNDTTAIWFMQAVGFQFRFIDYYEHRLVDLDHYANVLKERGYTYSDHYLPHDVQQLLVRCREMRRRFERLGKLSVRLGSAGRHFPAGSIA